MKTRARTERRRSAVRESILDGAREAIAEQGYQGFSMRKLAGKLGYSPGALYHYFETREDLLDQLVEGAFEKLLEVLNEVHDEKDAVLSLRNKLRAYIDFGLRFPRHYHFAFVLRASRSKAPGPYRPHAAYDVLRSSVRRCIEEERLPWPDVETTSQVLWITIHGVTSLLIARPDFPWVEQGSLIDRVLDTAIEGLARHSTDQTGDEDGGS
jgi:AcrR family transcriptional regulator